MDGTRQNGYCQGGAVPEREEELELVLGPEDSEVDLRFIVMSANRNEGSQDLSNLQHAGAE